MRAFARAPSFSLPALSPDGNHLSYISQSDARQRVVIRSLRDGAERHVLELDSRRERIRWCGWPSPARILCGTISPVRAPDRITEKTRLYSIRRTSGEVRELNTRLTDPVHDAVIDLLASRPGQVLLQHDPLGRGYPEVAELDIDSGALRQVVRAKPPVRRWMSDGRGNVHLGVGYDGSTGTLYVRRSRDPGQDHGALDEWGEFLRQSLTDMEAIGPLAIGAENTLYVLKHHAGRAALFALDLGEPPAPRLMFADPAYDVAGPVALDPRTRELLSVRYVRDHEEVHVFDAAEAQRRAWLDAQLPDAVNLIVDRAAKADRLLVSSASDRDAPSLYLFDTAKQALTLIGHQYPELESRTLAPMQALTYRTRDGHPVAAYLTLPRMAEARGLPAIVLPHGGPETRNMQSFDPLVQFLAAQGYAVLQMNFRGSLGYGAGFAAAGVGQWGGVVHNDITDGARWLVERGIADPARICIAGMSFGGYAALLGAARESQWYACAASFAGVADLMAFAQYTARLRDGDLWRERLGTDQQALWQMSPLARPQAIEVPVFMMHGRQDPAVPVTQMRRFARVLRNEGKTHHAVERADCDHEMTVESCRVAFFFELKRFIDAVLMPAMSSPAP